MLIRLLTALAIGSNNLKCISLSYQKRIAQLSLFNLHPNEYNQESLLSISG